MILKWQRLPKHSPSGANYIAVDGTYDDANRIAAQIGDSKGIGIVNINMRSYYVEGSKTLHLRLLNN